MLSRTASNLYWIGRYMERAEFTARLIEATIRLDSLSGRSDIKPVWASALAVVAGAENFAESEQNVSEVGARRYLALSPENPSSIRSCIATARDNARAARDVLTRELWEALNRAWQVIASRNSPGGAQATLHLVEQLKAETRGFEGALSRMLRTEAYWFVKLGQVIERGDNTARLLDVKYYLLLPPGEEIGGTLDRDQWTTLLQIVSGQNAYRAIYKQGLNPLLVVDLLVFRPELPRSLAAAAAETVALLGEFGKQSGRQGEADRLARRRLGRLENGSVEDLMKRGLHESLHALIQESAALDHTIAQQFQFS
jgi:uncharacterized alpha-E superfamily protein